MEMESIGLRLSLLLALRVGKIIVHVSHFLFKESNPFCSKSHLFIYTSIWFFFLKYGFIYLPSMTQVLKVSECPKGQNSSPN